MLVHFWMRRSIKQQKSSQRACRRQCLLRRSRVIHEVGWSRAIFMARWKTLACSLVLLRIAVLSLSVFKRVMISVLTSVRIRIQNALTRGSAYPAHLRFLFLSRTATLTLSTPSPALCMRSRRLYEPHIRRARKGRGACFSPPQIC